METVVMSIEDELQEYISQLDLSQKKSLLQLIKSFVKEESVGKPQTIEEYDRELKEAEKRIESGIFYTQEEVEAMAKNW